ncbi:DinB family protein [Sphingobacterium oryzagri]|uniref:DinB family protein n=1 Tax=Sphingobacterium oryzagri TaxID=3025669 RepID=A0ABY7WF29_9SPHI|nr:DinB family protein [Sphingobacterium sp. KACC 22765]WDF67136.1 DinB family protein [Sphingobacterium sp. KACC 22765]
MKNLMIIAIGLFVSTSIARAQSTKGDLISDWKRAKEYTIEYLEAMPDSKYSLKPTDDIRTFAEQMLHIADANYGFTSAALSTDNPQSENPLEKANDKSKSAVTKLVTESYDFVIRSIESTDDSEFGHSIRLFDSFEMTKRKALLKLFEHQTHHRGQTTIYLRLAGVVPPQEKLF